MIDRVNGIDPETGLPIPFTNFLDIRKLEYLVPQPDCDTSGGVIIAWRDARPQPTYDEIEAVLDADVEAAELEARALALSDIKPVITSVLEIIYENTPELQTAFLNVNAFKVAVKDRYKSKL